MSEAYHSKLEQRLIERNLDDTDESRNENRKQLKFTSFIIRQKQLLKTTIVDLSANGVGLHCNEPLDVDQTVELTLTPKDHDYINPIQVRLLIKSCFDLGSEGYRIGGELDNPPEFLSSLFELKGERDKNEKVANYAKRVGIMNK